MFKTNRVMILFCLIIHSAKPTNDKYKNQYSERKVKMNIEKKTDWLTYINKTSETSGQFETVDQNTPIILEWYRTDILSPKLATLKKEVSDMAAQTTATTEVEFLRKFPEAVSQEFLLKPCISLFENGPKNVNWELVEKTIQETIKQFYSTDIQSFGPEVIKSLIDDVYFFITIKDKKTEEILGFTILSITPAMDYGTIKLINLALKPSNQSPDLDKLLLSSIFQIVPQIKRIFTGIRSTNKDTLKINEVLWSLSWVK